MSKVEPETSEQQPAPRKVEDMWGVYQWGRLWYVEHKKSDAIAAVVRVSGEPWRRAKKYFRICRVRVRAT